MSKHAMLSKNDFLGVNINPNELWGYLLSKSFIDEKEKKLQKSFEIDNPADIGLSVEENKVVYKALKSIHLFANDKKYSQEVVNERDVGSGPKIRNN